MARTVSRGMLQVNGVTYRIERTAPHCYSVVRLLDDCEVGTFCTLPTLRMHPKQVDDRVMRDVVKAAMRSARTSAVMHVAPELPPENDRESSTGPASSVAPSPRSPSTMPPPERAIARA
jgi:hypothetical protein